MTVMEILFCTHSINENKHNFSLKFKLRQLGFWNIGSGYVSHYLTAFVCHMSHGFLKKETSSSSVGSNLVDLVLSCFSSSFHLSLTSFSLFLTLDHLAISALTLSLEYSFWHWDESLLQENSMLLLWPCRHLAMWGRIVILRLLELG